MNPDIERLAKEAGLIFGNVPFHHGPPMDKLAQFAALIAEECAKAVECHENAAHTYKYSQQGLHPQCSAYSMAAQTTAAGAIRQKFPMPGEQG